MPTQRQSQQSNRRSIRQQRVPAFRNTTERPVTNSANINENVEQNADQNVLMDVDETTPSSPSSIVNTTTAIQPAQQIIANDQNIHQLILQYFENDSHSNLPPLNSWNVSNVTNMEGLFRIYGSNKQINQNISIFNEDISSWDVSKVTNMKEMFREAHSFNQPLNNWNVSNVTDMKSMFFNAKTFNQPLNNWSVSNVTNMKSMFDTAKEFNQPLNNWNVSNVTDMNFMFYSAIEFNQPLNNWNVSKVTDMGAMFGISNKFNQPLNNWNVSNVTDMVHMFSRAKNFNQPLNNWNVSNVTDMNFMFYSAIEFNQPLNNWNVSNVTDMKSMFGVTNKFNQPLNNWDVSNVTNMSKMFERALKFNQPLNNWDVSNVTDMNLMFSNAIEFNQPLTNWNVRYNANAAFMFRGASSFNRAYIPRVFLQQSNVLPPPPNTPENVNIPINDTLPININEDTGMDFISGEEMTVSNYLKEDESNIVFYFQNKVISFMTKDQVKLFYTDPSHYGAAIKYGCKSIQHSLRPRRENLELDEPYFFLRTIGATGVAKLSEIKKIVNTKTDRCININSTPIKELASTASFQMIYSSDPAGVSASHCQEGHDEKVYSLEIIPVTLTGGRKRIRQTKNIKKRTKKIRRQRKTHGRKTNITKRR